MFLFGKEKLCWGKIENAHLIAIFERTIFGKYKRKSDLYIGIELKFLIVNLQEVRQILCNKGAVSGTNSDYGFIVERRDSEGNSSN